LGSRIFFESFLFLWKGEMAFEDSLVGISLVERDITKHVLLAWIYPGLEPTWEAIIDRHSGLKESEVQPRFIFMKNGQTWGYFLTIRNTNENELANIHSFTIVLLAKAFYPEKYRLLSQIFATVYMQDGSPPSLLKAYLEVFSKGSFDGSALEMDSFQTADFDPRLPLLVTSITDVIRMFGKEIILVWTALMMKKRVVVFCENQRNLLRIIRAFPIFAWHRQDWNILRPIVDLTHELEVADLRAAGVYCAGISDSAMKNKTEFYDVLVDVDERSILVTDHAKGDFMLTPFQRKLSELLVSSSESDDASDQKVIKEMVVKTKDLLEEIKSLKGDDDLLTPEKLSDAKLPTQTANFYFNIAAAEGLTKVTG